MFIKYIQFPAMILKTDRSLLFQVIEQPYEHGEDHLKPGQLKLAHENGNEMEAGNLSCPVPGCISSFRKQSTLEKHIVIGKHVYHESTSTTDVAMEMWANKCQNSVSVYHSVNDVISEATENDDNIVMEMPNGWALKSERKFVRFSPAIKQYVKNIFDEGEKTGKKANPITVSLQIRNEKDENGNHVFVPNDWISARQVRSLFANFMLKNQKESTSKEKRPKLDLSLKDDDDDDLNEVVRELDAIDAYNAVNSVTEQIIDL